MVSIVNVTVLEQMCQHQANGRNEGAGLAETAEMGY